MLRGKNLINLVLPPLNVFLTSFLCFFPFSMLLVRNFYFFFRLPSNTENTFKAINRIFFVRYKNVQYDNKYGGNSCCISVRVDKFIYLSPNQSCRKSSIKTQMQTHFNLKRYKLWNAYCHTLLKHKHEVNNAWHNA